MLYEVITGVCQIPFIVRRRIFSVESTRFRPGLFADRVFVYNGDYAAQSFGPGSARTGQYERADAIGKAE